MVETDHRVGTGPQVLGRAPADLPDVLSAQHTCTSDAPVGIAPPFPQPRLVRCDGRAKRDGVLNGPSSTSVVPMSRPASSTARTRVR